MTILVPLDTSSFAEQALPLAVSVARQTGARLHLVAVRASLPLGPDMYNCDQYLRTIVTRIEAMVPAGVTMAVLTNELAALHYLPPAPDAVAEVLARYADESAIDMVVMTTHGRGSAARAWLGSVADTLVRNSARPILLVRPQDENFGIAADADRGIRHILIPLDGSAAAEQAIPLARRLGQPFGARYTLLHVVTPMTAPLFTGELNAYPGVYASPLDAQAAAEYLAPVASGMRAAGLGVSTRVLESGDEVDAIIDYGKRHAADAIAMTTSGVGGIRRLFLGSVVDKVVRQGPIPTLVCNVRLRMEAGEPLDVDTAATSTAKTIATRRSQVPALVVHAMRNSAAGLKTMRGLRR